MYQRPFCDCLDGHTPAVAFHNDQQDTTADGWRNLLERIDQAAVDGREEFAPRDDIPDLEWMQIVTLPPTIGTLTAVKRLDLYGSHLIRIPPEIGLMTSLEEFIPYTSDRLHWFPYEIPRCANLKDSTVSTHALYGNFKYRPPFPQLQSGRATTEGFTRLIREFGAPRASTRVVSAIGRCTTPASIRFGSRAGWTRRCCRSSPMHVQRRA